MFGGSRLKRTCLASNSSAVMSLNILCDGQHEQAPWSYSDGKFDTAREAEYTPMFAKALATAILEAVAGEYSLPNVVQHAKRLKLSHFHSIAAGKQPAKAMRMPTVAEFDYCLQFAHFVAVLGDQPPPGCLLLCPNTGQYLFHSLRQQIASKDVQERG